MSRPENSEGFLSRWSRRKQEARNDERREVPAQSPDLLPGRRAEKDAGPLPSQEVVGRGGAGPDLAAVSPPELKLPDISSLTAASDIRPFMQAGVPQALRRAALARVWSLDPAIRDFREMADYDWDFNTPGAAPGYGPLEATADQIERWLARILPPERAREDQPAGATQPAVAASSASPPAAACAAPHNVGAAQQGAALPPAQPSDGDTGSEPVSMAVRPRRHGGAVPV